MTQDLLDKSEVSVEIKILETTSVRIGIFFHLYYRVDDILYIMDWDQDENPATPFTVNTLKYNSDLDLYEATYPLQAPIEMWYANGRDTWEDYKNR